MSPGRTLPLRHRSYWLMRQTKILPPIPVPFADGSSQVVANPCWEMALPDVISAFLVWVLGPIPRDVTSVRIPVSSRSATAIAQGAKSSAHPTIPAKQFQLGVQISRLQSFTHVQAPTLARPPGCSHRRKKADFLGGQAVYTAQNPVGYLPRVAASLHARIGQLAWLDSHQLECSLVGCSRTRWTTNEISWSHRILQSQSTSRAWSH
jgi:hypothetical protein